MEKPRAVWFEPSGLGVLFASTHLDLKAKQKQQAQIAQRKEGRARRYSWNFDPNYDLFVARNKDFTRLTARYGYDAEASFSPDGQHILFASNAHAYVQKLSPEQRKRLDIDPGYFVDLYIMRADGSALRQLTVTPGYDGGPFFSPDGKRIVWRRFNNEGTTAEIWTMNTDGTDPRPITTMGAMSWAPFFHPSGDYIVFATNVHGFDNFELYMVLTGGGTPVRVTQSDGFDGLPVFSPNGKTLSWTSNRAGSSQIYLARWNDALARRRLGLPRKRTQDFPNAPRSRHRTASAYPCGVAHGQTHSGPRDGQSGNSNPRNNTSKRNSRKLDSSRSRKAIDNLLSMWRVFRSDVAIDLKITCLIRIGGRLPLAKQVV